MSARVRAAHRRRTVPHASGPRSAHPPLPARRHRRVPHPRARRRHRRDLHRLLRAARSHTAALTDHLRELRVHLRSPPRILSLFSLHSSSRSTFSKTPAQAAICLNIICFNNTPLIILSAKF